MKRQVKKNNRLPSPAENKSSSTALKNKVKVNKSKSDKPKKSKANSPKISTKPIKSSSKSFKNTQRKKQKELLKKQKWIESRKKLFPKKTLKEIRASYAKHKAYMKSPERKAKLQAYREAKLANASTEKENLLQQYKKYQKKLYSSPTMREVAWENFKAALNELPTELQMEFMDVVDFLEKKYGPEAVAYYLDKRGLLEQINNYWGVDYKSMISRIYLYQLAEGLDAALSGESVGNFQELYEQATWMDEYSIQRIASEKNQSYYEYMLEPEVIEDINLEIDLNKFFDTIIDEPYT